LYTWAGVVGGRTPVVTMVRTSRSVRKLQEQMIMKASPAPGPHTSCKVNLKARRHQWQSTARRGEMATFGGRRCHFDCCPSLCLLLAAERQQWERLQGEFVYSRAIAPNSIATQFAAGRCGRSQRRRASPGIKRAGFPSPLGVTNSRAGTDAQVRSRRQPEDRRRFGCQFPFVPKVRAT
jgi:hypothetical protein